MKQIRSRSGGRGGGSGDGRSFRAAAQVLRTWEILREAVLTLTVAGQDDLGVVRPDVPVPEIVKVPGRPGLDGAPGRKRIFRTDAPGTGAAPEAGGPRRTGLRSWAAISELTMRLDDLDFAVADPGHGGSFRPTRSRASSRYSSRK